MAWSRFNVLLTLICWVRCCYGNPDLTSQIVTLEQLPAGLEGYGPVKFVVRSIYKSDVEFIPSDKFRVLINATAGPGEDLSELHYSLQEQEGAAVLEIYKEATVKRSSPVYYIGVAIGSGAAVAFILVILFICWWNKQKRPHLKEHKFQYRDSSRAPLLTGRANTQERPHKNGNHSTLERRACKEDQPRSIHSTPDMDSRDARNSIDSNKWDATKSNIETERNTLPRPTRSPGQGHVMMQDIPMTGSFESPSSTLESEGSKQHKPVIAHIKMDEPYSVKPKVKPKKKGKQYVPLETVDTPESEVHNHPTLKIRGGAGAMNPSVADQEIHGPPVGMRPKKRAHFGPVAIAGVEPSFPDPYVSDDSSTTTASLPGSQVSTLLSRPRDGIPAVGPPILISPKRHLEGDLCDADLDSVASSRSGASSRSTGSQGHIVPTSELLHIDTRGAMRNDSTDSESARSSSSRSGTSSGVSSFGKSASSRSPQESSTDQSMDSLRSHTRFVDEAYGTMGSLNSGTLRSSSSATSTTSGSSGSAATVVAAPDSGSLQRRAVTNHRPGDEFRTGAPDEDDSVWERNVAYNYGSGGPGSKFGSPYMRGNMMVVAAMAILACVGCVLAQVHDETHVHIRIYAPPGLLRDGSEVYFNQTKENTVYVDPALKLDVHRYDVQNPYVEKKKLGKCEHKMGACAQQCDRNTGDCICRKGYRLDTMGFKCEDNDECGLRDPVCHRGAICTNLIGSFKCTCRQGYYNNGSGICLACELPCKEGSFELAPCTVTYPKICKECSNECPAGKYREAPCNRKNNIRCKECSPKCNPRQFESVPCGTMQDRRCTSMSQLDDPELSTNLIPENKRGIQSQMSNMALQEKMKAYLNVSLVMTRGDFTININVIGNLAPLYQAVDHSENNENKFFAGDRKALAHCPYPMPEKYILRMQNHKDVTTRAKYIDCQPGKKCKTETGYYLDPARPCHTYDPFGVMPQVSEDSASIMCVWPGELTKVFKTSDSLLDYTTLMVDKTQDCSHKRTNCRNCNSQCASQMQGYRGGNRCNITAGDADDGNSPRLMYCHTCCCKSNCSRDCHVYSNSDCPLQRCVTGNVIEFRLEPRFSSQRTKYACHIKPRSGYNIYEIKYHVMYKGKMVNNRIMKAKKEAKGEHPVNSFKDHGFLRIFHGSDFEDPIDILEGDTRTGILQVGNYYVRGNPINKDLARGNTMYIRPREPFGISSKQWVKEDCDTKLMNDMLRAPPGDPTLHKTPFTENPELIAHNHDLSRGNFRIFNREKLPFIYFVIPTNASILENLYEKTTVKDDGSLRATLTENTRHWIISIQGQLNKCPGFFQISVLDPLYPENPLYDYNVGVNCPRDFSITFKVRNFHKNEYDKKYNVVIKDGYRKIKMVVAKPLESIDEDTLDDRMTYENSGEAEMSVLTPVTAVLGVIVAFLLLILFVGFITDRPGPRRVKGSDNKVGTHHLLFVIGYVTFQTAYSIAMTFTVLFLLMELCTREPMSAMSEYPRHTETADSLQKIETERIQEFVEKEINRQHTLVNVTKGKCEQHLNRIQDQLELAKRNLSVTDTSDRKVTMVARKYSDMVLIQFHNRLNKFREEFGHYAQRSLDQLLRSIVETSSGLKNNKWLSGARMIYDTVQARRLAQGRDTKNFEKWVGINQEVKQLAAVLSPQNLPLPDMTEFLNVKLPPLNRSANQLPAFKSVNLPENKWYFKYEEQPTPPSHEEPQVDDIFDMDMDLGLMPMFSFMVFIVFTLTLDFIWFIHRMAKTFATAKLILYGYPCYIDAHGHINGSPKKARVQDGAKSKSCSKKFYNSLKNFNFRVMKTDCIPKLVAVVTACGLVYLVMTCAAQLLTVKTLAQLGHFENTIAPVEASYSLAKTRIKTNAYRINKFEYPFYEELSNMRLKRYQLMLEMYKDIQENIRSTQKAEICTWQSMIDDDSPCNCSSRPPDHIQLQFSACELVPVIPKPYKREDLTEWKMKLTQTSVPYLNAARKLVSDLCHLIIIFIGLLVLVDLLGAVLWIYLKRFQMLRVKPLYEIEEYPEQTRVSQ